MVSDRARGLLLAAGLVAGAVYLAVFDPSAGAAYPACPVRATTDTHCPGCGTARALHALLGGDLRQALAWNPVTTLLSPLLGLLLVDDIVGRIRGRPWLPWRVPGWAVYGLAAALVAFWILRNLPGFEGLAPHQLGG